MSKVSVIYRAPPGDNKVCEWGAYTFFDGVPTEIEANDDNAQMIKTISQNRHFELSEMGVKGKSGPQPGPKPVPDPAKPAPPPPPEGDEEDEDDKKETEVDEDEPPFEDYKPRKKAARGK